MYHLAREGSGRSLRKRKVQKGNPEVFLLGFEPLWSKGNMSDVKTNLFTPLNGHS
jgi:hypothetical protein